jgi:hypothetical protein
MRWVPARSYCDSQRMLCKLSEWRRKTYLENHSRRDNGRDTQFHQCTTVTGQHHTEPVKRIGSVRGHDTVQGHLAHNQEDQQGQL